MKTLYDTYVPNAEARRPGRNPDALDADILTVGWLLEYIGKDSENSGYQRIKAELKSVFPSLPVPVCDFKRAKSSKSDLKWADATGTLATYGNCATKSLGTFFGFRGTAITMTNGLPVDFAIAPADTDDR